MSGDRNVGCGSCSPAAATPMTCNKKHQTLGGIPVSMTYFDAAGNKQSLSMIVCPLCWWEMFTDIAATPG